MFGTEANLDLLVTNKNWGADGTFDLCPPLFSQLYTIHAKVYGAMLPLVFCLLPNKEQATYTLAHHAIFLLSLA